MRYRFVAVYEIRGLIHARERGDVEVYAEEGTPSLRVILTDRVDEYCYEMDRSQSLGYVLLKSLVGQRESSDLRVELEGEVNRIRERRKKELERSEVFVFMAEGEAEANFSRPSRETDDFVLGFEVIDKDKISDTHSAQVNAALAALCLATEQESIQVRRLRRDVYLVNEHGKPVYSFGFSGGDAGFASRSTTDEVIRKAQIQVAALTRETSLTRVNRLLVQAITRDNDNVRRFIFGWSALEILINKVFSEYEKLFVQNLLGCDPASHMEKYFARIRDVMKGKYRLEDKFVVVAACLGGDRDIDADIEIFAGVKKKRDALLHGEIIEEAALPSSQAIELLKEYLRRHLSRSCLGGG